jgi:hypothetical protein
MNEPHELWIALMLSEHWQELYNCKLSPFIHLIRFQNCSMSLSFQQNSEPHFLWFSYTCIIECQDKFKSFF